MQNGLLLRFRTFGEVSQVKTGRNEKLGLKKAKSEQLTRENSLGRQSSLRFSPYSFFREDSDSRERKREEEALFVDNDNSPREKR